MDDSVFVLEGWRFEAIKSSALSSSGRADMSERFLLPHVPLPEMLFADNALVVTHEATGWSVAFRAEDALESWAKTQRQEHHVQAIEYDVAYTCHYRGTLCQGTIVDNTKEEIPLHRLKERAAILFYSDVILFEDDIRDLGEVECSVKIRVMAFGFLILCRFYARIDNKSVKLHDARYYHEFGTNYLLRDYETRQAIPEALQEKLHISNSDDLDQDCSYFVPTPEIVYNSVVPDHTERERIDLLRSAPNNIDFISSEATSD